ncbi:MAG TPA: hypothetical protein VK364_11665 [Hymenobacter sp.]|nr:hypothetical protein [Hymenobacter sp.]
MNDRKSPSAGVKFSDYHQISTYFNPKKFGMPTFLRSEADGMEVADSLKLGAGYLHFPTKALPLPTQSELKPSRTFIFHTHGKP